MKLTKRITLVFSAVSLPVFVAVGFGQVAVQKVAAAPAACYSGDFGTVVRMNSCPSPSSTVTYPGGSAADTTPRTCYVADEGVNRYDFRAEDCSGLEALADAYFRSRCTGSGGEVSANTSGGSPVLSCRCPSGQAFQNGSCNDVQQVGGDDQGNGGAVIADSNYEVQCEGENLQPGDDCLLLTYLQNGINLFSALVGIVSVFSIIWAGYQYMTARDNPSAVSAAKTRIMWTLIALLVYLFMYGILNWLIPGGIIP